MGEDNARKTSSTDEVEEVEFHVPEELVDAKKDLKQIRDLFILDLDGKKMWRDIKSLVQIIIISGQESSFRIAHKPIEMWNETHQWLETWRLVGPNSIIEHQRSLFNMDNGELVQTMPVELTRFSRKKRRYVYIFDSQKVKFIDKLINNIDATIEALVEEHLNFSPGGKGEDNAKKTSSTDEVEEVEFHVPEELVDAKKDLKQIRDLFILDLDGKKMWRDIKSLVQIIIISGQESSFRIAHKPIEMWDETHQWLETWRLVGPNSRIEHQRSLFNMNNGELVQTMPVEDDYGGGMGEEGIFDSQVEFIDKLINNIDATIEALVEEHLNFSPGGKGAEAALDEFSKTFNDSGSAEKGGRRKRKTKRRKRKTKRRKIFGKKTKTRRKTKRKRKRRKHRRKSKHTKR